jgi:hypothetical protein
MCGKQPVLNVMGSGARLCFGKIPKFGKMTIRFRVPNPTDVEKLEKSAPFCVDALASLLV